MKKILLIEADEGNANLAREAFAIKEFLEKIQSLLARDS